MEVGKFVAGIDSQSPQSPAGPHPAPVPPPLPPHYARPVPPAPRPRRTLLEILLDPRSIQWLLASGGVLLTVGLVIWLASLGVFKNPYVVATLMGTATVAALAGGWSIIRYTRFELAGRAVTLLACLVMPLNLWFYHSHQIMTLDGHLWVAALACCGLYAASAWVLKDPTFVFVLMGGITLTGTLILADLHALAQIAAPATMLITLGVLAIFAERAFPDEGVFSRRRFGLAFFWSGHVVMAAGLLLILGAQIAGWLWAPIFSQFPALAVPAIVTQQSLRVLALVLILIGAGVYIYSDLVVRRLGWYVYAAAIVLMWGQVVAIDVLHLSHMPGVMILVMAATALVINLFQSYLWKSAQIARPIAPLGWVMGLLPVVLGVTLHLRATHSEFRTLWPYTITWGYVVAMFAAAASCRISAHLYRASQPRWVGPYLFASAAATLVGAAGLLWVLGLQSWAVQAPVLMLLPIGYLVAGRIEKDPIVSPALNLVAHVATCVMIASVLGSALEITPRYVQLVVGHSMNLLLATFWAEAAVFFALHAVFTRKPSGVYAAAAMGTGALWQFLSYFSMGPEYYTIAFAAVALAVLILHRIAARQDDGRQGVSLAAFQCANVLLTIAFVSAMLLTLSRLAAGISSTRLIVLPATLAAMSFVASAIVRRPGLRRGYVVLAIMESALTMLALQTNLHLRPIQNLEVFSVALGLILLVAGHIGWYREQQTRHSDAVSFGLTAGSLLAGVPLAIAFLAHRFAGAVSIPDELGLLTVSILLFVTGMLFEIRATTFTGGLLLAMHLVMLLIFTGMRAQLAMGVYLAVGGAVLFALGVILSIYRDRLLALPEQIRQRRGIFRILSWR